MPRSKEYKLYVYCRLNDVSRDAGTHAGGEFSDDGSAITALTESAGRLLSHYDEVHCTISEGERVVKKFSLYRPRAATLPKGEWGARDSNWVRPADEAANC